MKERQEELEQKIRSNWKDLKNQLRPVNMAKDAYTSFVHHKTEEAQKGDSVLKSTLSYGASLLAKKIADKTGERLNRFFKK